MTSTRQSLFLLLVIAVLATAEIRNKGWWNHTVFYQIYPRSFKDSNGDGVGDLKGITQNLNYFVKSGVGAIWLSPINRSPMVDFGYDISDFRDIDETFGELKDFDDLIKEAKKLGIKVILDLVPNHTSDEHYWFEQSVKKKGKYTDYYVWRDGNGNSPPNNWLSVFGGSAWTYHPERKQWYFHQFHARQPDLNYNSTDVQEEMKDIILYWLNKGVDGFRIDAVPHLFENDTKLNEPESKIPGASPNEYNYLSHIFTKDHPETYKLVQSWRHIVDEYANVHNTDEKVIMTEAYTSLENTVKFYNFGSHVPFNFKFIMEVNSLSTAKDFENTIAAWTNSMPKGSVQNWVMGNHDRARVATRYPGRPDQMTMLAMILPGVAVTYYGEEIGMENHPDISFKDTQDPQGCQAGVEKYKEKSRDPCRTPFQWNNKTNADFSTAAKTWIPVHSNYEELNLERQMANKKESHYNVYTTLTKMRNSTYSLKHGNLRTSVLNNEVLAVIRHTSNETTTLLINFSNNETRKVDLSKLVTGKSEWKVKSVNASIDLTKSVDLSNVQLPAKASAVIFSYKSSATKLVSDIFKVILPVLCSLLFTLQNR